MFTLKKLSNKLGIEKSSPKSKADIHINEISYSIKYMSAAPPSIINHTTRKGFVRIATKLNLNISDEEAVIMKTPITIISIAKIINTFISFPLFRITPQQTQNHDP